MFHYRTCRCVGGRLSRVRYLWSPLQCIPPQARLSLKEQRHVRQGGSRDSRETGTSASQQKQEPRRPWPEQRSSALPLGVPSCGHLKLKTQALSTAPTTSLELPQIVLFCCCYCSFFTFEKWMSKTETQWNRKEKKKNFSVYFCCCFFFSFLWCSFKTTGKRQRSL